MLLSTLLFPAIIDGPYLHSFCLWDYHSPLVSPTPPDRRDGEITLSLGGPESYHLWGIRQEGALWIGGYCYFCCGVTHAQNVSAEAGEVKSMCDCSFVLLESAMCYWERGHPERGRNRIASHQTPPLIFMVHMFWFLIAYQLVRGERVLDEKTVPSALSTCLEAALLGAPSNQCRSCDKSRSRQQTESVTLTGRWCVRLASIRRRVASRACVYWSPREHGRPLDHLTQVWPLCLAPTGEQRVLLAPLLAQSLSSPTEQERANGDSLTWHHIQTQHWEREGNFPIELIVDWCLLIML